MSMIKCPECQQEINDTSTSCPNCGCPFNTLTKTKSEKIKYSKKNLIIIVCAFIICLLGIVFVGTKSYNDRLKAITINEILENLTTENAVNTANDLMPYGQVYNIDVHKIDETINNFQKTQQQYNSLNSFQKKYITDRAKDNVENIEKVIDLCEQLKQMKQVYEEKGIAGLLKEGGN